LAELRMATIAGVESRIFRSVIASATSIQLNNNINLSKAW